MEAGVPFMSALLGLHSCVCGHRKALDSEPGLALASPSQHVVANRFLHWVNEDAQTANCCSSSAAGCVCAWSRKSSGQMGLLLTSPPPWQTRRFDLHIMKSYGLMQLRLYRAFGLL